MVGYTTGALLKKTANLRRALRTMSCLAILIPRNPKDRSSEKSAEDDGKPPVDIFDLVCIHISGDLNAEVPRGSVVDGDTRAPKHYSPDMSMPSKL